MAKVYYWDGIKLCEVDDKEKNKKIKKNVDFSKQWWEKDLWTPEKENHTKEKENLIKESGIDSMTREIDSEIVKRIIMEQQKKVETSPKLPVNYSGYKELIENSNPKNSNENSNENLMIEIEKLKKYMVGIKKSNNSTMTYLIDKKDRQIRNLTNEIENLKKRVNNLERRIENPELFRQQMELDPYGEENWEK